MTEFSKSCNGRRLTPEHHYSCPPGPITTGKVRALSRPSPRKPFANSLRSGETSLLSEGFRRKKCHGPNRSRWQGHLGTKTHLTGGVVVVYDWRQKAEESNLIGICRALRRLIWPPGREPLSSILATRANYIDTNCVQWFEVHQCSLDSICKNPFKPLRSFCALKERK